MKVILLQDVKALGKKGDVVTVSDGYARNMILPKKLGVEVKIKAGEGGRTFGSVSTKEISAAVRQQLNLELDKKKMLLSEPIKSLGMTEVPVKLHAKVTAILRVKVTEA